jgi:hypothetical protein
MMDASGVRTELDWSPSAVESLAYFPPGPTVMAPEGGELRANAWVTKTQATQKETKILEVNILKYRLADLVGNNS